MKTKHILHIGIGVFMLFSGYNIGQAIYTRFLKTKVA